MWLLIPAALCWVTWEEGNRRLFEGKKREMHLILNASLARMYSWLFVTQNKEAPLFSSWIYDWDSVILHE